MRLFLSLLIASLLLSSCAPKIIPAQSPSTVRATAIRWPQWRPGQSPPPPKSITKSFPGGQVLTFGTAADETEEFLILGDRRELPPTGIGAIPIAFMPTSALAGENPLGTQVNTLRGPRGGTATFPALDYRSSFFSAKPALSAPVQGTIFYHTSIMMLSIAEKAMVQRFRKKGWHVIVAIPSDGFYRSRLPVYLKEKENPEAAARYLAADMDRHFHEQAKATQIALRYLRHSRPSWLKGRQVLMGTSGGSFSLPAVALKNPNHWEKIIFVSPGANLMTTYEKGAAGIFSQTLAFVDTIRHKPPTNLRRIPSNEEYHALYRRAAQLTKLQPGKLAPHLKKQNTEILFLNGTLDRILPPEEIEEIHQALGQPERWTYPLGHQLIALNLITQVNRLHQWMLRPLTKR